MPAQRRTIAERVNDYLVEPPGEQFVNGKWKFWFIAVAFLAVVNAALTWLIFKDDGENYSGPIMLSVGALVAWLCVGALHYSDSSNRQLARGVSAVDSFALIFVVVHFSGLLYVYGHHRTLRSAEARYEAQAEKFNVEARQVQDANIKIAEAAQTIAKETTKAEKLRNDTAYQQRKAAEAGGRIIEKRQDSFSDKTSGLATSTVELERPVKPTESSAVFLTEWDWLIRAANCGELLLACLTLILIRNVSARSNNLTAPPVHFVDFGVTARTPAPVGNLTKKKEPAKNHGSFDSRGLKILRDALRDISFRLHNLSFKSAVRGDAVWIYLMRANNGTQETEASAKAKLSLLDDAVSMPRDAFRERLERFLTENGFEI
jgi:hypothetical protein